MATYGRGSGDFGRRLARVINDLAADNNSALAKSLKIGRKRIRALRDNAASATISLEELDRLDGHLLSTGGRGLREVVPGKRPLFHSIAQRHRVELLLGMRRIADAQHLRLVDFEAAMSLQEALTQARLASGTAPQAFGTRTALVGERAPAWPAEGSSPSSRALLCFGSPKSNPFTGAMFERLVSRGQASPFWLGFPEPPSRPSRFVRHEPRWRYRGVGLGRDLFLGDAKRSFGVVIAHRGNGPLAIACAGTTGQATLACVQILADIADDAPSDPRLALFVIVEARHTWPRDSELTGRGVVQEQWISIAD